MAKTHRIQMDVTEKSLAEFNRLMRVCDLKTKTQLFNEMATLFNEAVEAAQSGKNIGVIDRGQQALRCHQDAGT